MKLHLSRTKLHLSRTRLQELDKPEPTFFVRIMLLLCKEDIDTKSSISIIVRLRMNSLLNSAGLSLRNNALTTVFFSIALTNIIDITL